MITNEQLQLFSVLFKGRKDVYARRWEKNGRGGYSPAYSFNWNEFMAFKARGGTLNDFPTKKQLVLTLEVIMSHLEGTQTIGIYPLKIIRLLLTKIWKVIIVACPQRSTSWVGVKKRTL
jgi:hypothetical protein